MPAVALHPSVESHTRHDPSDPDTAWKHTRAQLSPYLRSLWNIAPALLEANTAHTPDALEPRPFISPLGMHLPAAPHEPRSAEWYRAAAAHAAAHLVFSNHRFALNGLRPVSQALLGLLEDARVEWLACRELPGLRRLWLPFHETTAVPEPTFEGLMQRLARSLLDPTYRDPHPWVVKGVRLFFMDDAGEVIALRQPDALRHAASLLGNDIGQMRLQFNVRQYAVAPSYRDDNTWLWIAKPAQTDAPQLIADASHDEATPNSAPPDATPQVLHDDPGSITRHREWDRLVPMYRNDWATVIERRAANVTSADRAALTASHASLLRRLRRHMQAHFATARVRMTRQTDGDEFDLDALVQRWVERRSGGVAEPRVHLQARRSGRHVATLLLLDASASTAQPVGGSDPNRGPNSNHSVLDTTRIAALLCALALQRAGRPCAIHAFCSEGRHAVHFDRIKDFDAPLDDACTARLMGLRSRFSTRLGAALRHATRLLASQRSMAKRILLITDGEPHDIDVHDPRYLVEDARQAVREAARRGIGVFCIGLTPAAQRDAPRIFGRHGHHALANLDALPGVLTRLAMGR